MTRSISIVFAVAILAHPAFGANKFLDGSFEARLEPPFAPNPHIKTLPAGDTSIPGWTIVLGRVDYVATYRPPADQLQNIPCMGLAGYRLYPPQGQFAAVHAAPPLDLVAVPATPMAPGSSARGRTHCPKTASLAPRTP